MKNLKKLLAVIVAICVLATFTVPAFAAETTAAKTDAEIATELGVILGEGGGVTADYLASQPTRLQGAIMFLRLKGLEGAAKAFTGTDNFEDVSVVNDTNKAILAYLKANPDLGFQGVGNNTFAPLKEMTAKEYYKILLVALGYEENTDFTWANVLSFAAGKGLVKLIDNEKFTVNDLCIGTVEALKATVKGGTDTLIAKLVEGNSISSDKAVASGLYNPVAKALEVVSATADTLKTAKIVFNKELDSATIKAANFSNSKVTKDPILLDDKKTVVVVLKDALTEQSKTEDITIKNVKAVDGTKIAEVKKTVTFVDTTIPVVTGAVAKNAKTIVISTSEPMNAENEYVKVFDDIKIDGSAVIATSSVDFAKNTVVLHLTSIMSKGAHKLDIASLKDYANYTAVATSFNIDVPEDTTAPAIASAKMNGVKEIEVTFNEDVDNLAKGTFWVNGEEVTSVNAVQKDSDHSVFTLKFTNALTIGATVEIKVEYKGQKDVVGNEVKDKTAFTFKVTDDTTLPTVSATIEGKNKIVLTFSKNMLKAGTMKVYNVSDGKQIGSNISLAEGQSGITWDSASVVKIDAAAGTTGLDSTNAKEIKINLTGIKDATIRANALVETNINLQAIDTKRPTVAEFYTSKQGDPDDKDDTITFYFSEAMNSESLKNLSNYNVVTTAGAYTLKQALSAYSDVSISSIASDNKSVTIKAKSIADSLPGFQVYAATDIAGNMLETGTVTNIPADKPYVSTATAIAGNKIELEFSQKIGYFAPGAFILREGTSTSSPVSATVVSGSIDGKKVTLTLDRDIGTTTNKAYLHALNTKLVKNEYGTESTTTASLLASGPVPVVDKIKPTVTFAATTAGIWIQFSEAVTSSGSFESEVALTKNGDPVDISTSYSAITVIDGKYTIKISGLDKNTEYKIQLYPRGVIKDTNTNWFVPTELKAVTTKP